jgi:aminopeptidase N
MAWHSAARERMTRQARRSRPHERAAATPGPAAARATVAVLVLLALLLIPLAACAGSTSGPGATQASTQASTTASPAATAPAGPAASASPSSSTGSSATSAPPSSSTTALETVPSTGTTAVPAARATPGSPGSSDPYFPSFGDGGYDVQSYDLTLDIDPVSGRIAGDEVVSATALQALSAFYLDLQGLDVATVQVNGAAAAHQQSGHELEVTCPAALANGAAFTVTVRYSGIPQAVVGKLFTEGWQKVGDTIFTLDEPQGAATWFAVNDTPADKATYTFHLTVPAAYTATANGILTGTQTAGTSRTFTWKIDQPVASYLAEVDVGKFTFETSRSPGGVTIRNYFATDLATAAHTAFAPTGQVIDYFSSLFGPYPFPVYGVIVPDADTGAAMENETMSLFGRDVVTKRMTDPESAAMFLSHELAHQWFGDSVTIEHWDDIWLNEGFATYASWLWVEHDQGPQAFSMQVQRSWQSLARSIEPPPGTPGPDHLFGASVYQRGALTLQALRLTVGDAPFFEILRSWAGEHKYGNASTAGFINLAKQKAPQVPAATLDQLFQAWLYGSELPSLPKAGVAS